MQTAQSFVDKWSVEIYRLDRRKGQWANWRPMPFTMAEGIREIQRAKGIGWLIGARWQLRHVDTNDILPEELL